MKQNKSRAWAAFSLACLLLSPLPCCAIASLDGPYESAWSEETNRVWLGPEYWANPWEDWCVRSGRIECLSRGKDRNVHLLTRDLAPDEGDIALDVRLGFLDQKAKAPGGWAGFKIGARGRFDDYRDSAVRGKGLHAGITFAGVLFIGKPKEDDPSIGRAPDDVGLELRIAPVDGSYKAVLLAFDSSGTKIAEKVCETIEPESLVGNIALVCNGKGNLWFRDFKVAGSKVRAHPGRVFGPILFAQHTLSRGIVKMTAQMPPLGESDSKAVLLQFRKGWTWKTVGETTIDPHARTATFRVTDHDDSHDTPYRLVYSLRDAAGHGRDHCFEGTIRRNPTDREKIVVAAFTGNNDVGFPHQDVVDHVSFFRPDLLVFTGDQIYEGIGGYGCPRSPLDRSLIAYLRKWSQYGWEYRELLRHTPSIAIPDDHDVFHGNLWGAGGKATDFPQGSKAQDTGGYKMPPDFVNAVQRTQTSHHPDPFDPTPVKQGIGVYYGAMNYGGISFAVIEDRKFKSAPKMILPEAKINNGWAQNLEYDAAREGDAPGAVLLGERQLKFLEEWAADWSCGAWMKVVISQTIFANVATLPVEVHHDNVTPRLKIWPVGEYAPNERPVQDHDSNGWPQTGRNRALEEMRRGFAFHIAGDQHLGSTIRYGIDDWNDAGCAICVPSVANVWPRRWFPPEPGKNRKPGSPKYTGDFHDGFGNKITVRAVSNPHAVDVEPTDINNRAPGYGIISFHRGKRSITLANWPRWVDPAAPGAKPYPGWPITVTQRDNYGRKPAAWLPPIEVADCEDPVIQVIRDKDAEVVYTLRIKGKAFQPWTFESGRHTVVVSDPDRNATIRLEGLDATEKEAATTMRVAFEK